MNNVLIIPDFQAPFEHQDAVAFLAAVAKRYKPTQVVQIGDLVDSHALSAYDTDPDGLSAGDELTKTIASLRQLYKLFPNVKVVMGNHDDRIFRKAFSAGIPRRYLKALQEVLEMPEGWEIRSEWVIDNIVYEHGDKFGNGSGNNAFKKAIDLNMRSTVYGHFHSAAGIRWFANKRYLHFAFNVGCLMDTHSYAAAYGANFPQKPILGCGIVSSDGVPSFVPMTLNNKHRWIGL